MRNMAGAKGSFIFEIYLLLTDDSILYGAVLQQYDGAAT